MMVLKVFRPQLTKLKVQLTAKRGTEFHPVPKPQPIGLMIPAPLYMNTVRWRAVSSRRKGRRREAMPKAKITVTEI